MPRLHTIRNLDLSYEQYEAFRDTRAAATDNLRLQIARRITGQAIFLEVLQAISDWGDAIASEANSLTEYNASLAGLERETGTILETHGVTFVEEQYASIGALGQHFEWDCYPRSLQPQSGPARYQDSEEPSEEAFELRGFDRLDERPEQNNAVPKENQQDLVPNVLEVTPVPQLEDQSAVDRPFRLLPVAFLEGSGPVRADSLRRHPTAGATSPLRSPASDFPASDSPASTQHSPGRGAADGSERATSRRPRFRWLRLWHK